MLRPCGRPVLPGSSLHNSGVAGRASASCTASRGAAEAKSSQWPNSTKSVTESECPVCFKEEPNHALLPCCHQLCKECASRLNKCPMCRAWVDSVVPLHVVPPLTALCSKAIASQLQVIGREDQLSVAPPNYKRSILSQVSNKRLLYGQALRSLVCGSGVVRLDLSHATNFSHEDINAILPHIATCSTISMESCLQLDDDAVTSLLQAECTLMCTPFLLCCVSLSSCQHHPVEQHRQHP